MRRGNTAHLVRNINKSVISTLRQEDAQIARLVIIARGLLNARAVERDMFASVGQILSFQLIERPSLVINVLRVTTALKAHLYKSHAQLEHIILHLEGIQLPHVYHAKMALIMTSLANKAASLAGHLPLITNNALVVSVMENSDLFKN